MSESAAIGPAARRRLAGFARTLRESGFRVGLAETRDALRLLASPASARPGTLKPAFRALFSARQSDWQRFDALFDAYWLGERVRSRQQAATGREESRPAPGHTLQRSRMPDRAERGAGETAEGDGKERGATRAERLAATDVRHIADPEEVAAAHALAERLARAMRARLVRRWQAARRGRRLDLRRTIHGSVPRGGTPVDLAWRRRRVTPLRLVILLDASGSMSLYTAFFVRFIHGVVDSFREAEAFVFHTRLVHVSETLRERDAARAVERMALLAQGIGGGTRIGESLADFNRWHAARVIHGRTAVMIVSDGYDTGEPAQLAAEMARLRRRTRRIIWLNPLLGWERYAPEARGMRAALPFIDLFAPAHNLASLAALEPYLARI